MKSYFMMFLTSDSCICSSDHPQESYNLPVISKNIYILRANLCWISLMTRL